MSEEKKHKILSEDDYIDSPKFKNSLKKLLEKFPDGVDDTTIASILNITEQEVQDKYKSAILKIKKQLNL